MPRQMARPKPDPSTPDAGSAPAARENLRNSSGSISAGMPRPWSETDTATWTASRTADTAMGDPSGE